MSDKAGTMSNSPQSVQPRVRHSKAGKQSYRKKIQKHDELNSPSNKSYEGYLESRRSKHVSFAEKKGFDESKLSISRESSFGSDDSDVPPLQLLTAPATPTGSPSVYLASPCEVDLARLTPDSCDGRAWASKPSSNLQTIPSSDGALFTINQDGSSNSQCSGLEVLRRLRVHMDSLTGLTRNSDDPAGGVLVAALDRPIALDLLKTRSLSQVFLPPYARFLECIDIAFAEVLSLWPVPDRSVIDSIVFRMYSTPTFGHMNVHEDELALLYATLALGERFEWMSVPIIDSEFQDHRLGGMAYFKAASALVQPSDCQRSMAALQTTMCLAIYLISASAHTLAYSHISGAVAAVSTLISNQRKVERSNRSENFHPVIDKSTYRTLKALDIYVSSFLGFPSSDLVSNPTIKIHRFLQPVDASSDSTNIDMFAEAHSTLLEILADVQQRAYLRDLSKRSESYVVSTQMITEITAKFAAWYETKTPLLAPAPQMASAQQLRSRLLLHYAYACVRMIAYAPFLHYVCEAKCIEKDHGGYLAGSLCVTAAIQASRVARVLESHSMFNICSSLSYNGPVLTATILLAVQLGTADFPGINEVRDASISAEYTLHRVATRDTSAAACAESLKPLYKVFARMYQC